MLKNLLILPDGREIGSGAAGAAIRHLSWTEQVCDQVDLTPGAVCAAMLEAQLLEAADVQLDAGQQIALYKVDEAGNRYPMGIFLCEKPVRPSAATLHITAFDRVSLLDRDLTQWLAQLKGWPYALADFAAMVCRACGLEPALGTLRNADFPVQPFSAQGITGRQLMQWICQLGGRFCRANAAGQLEFAWFTPAAFVSVDITDSVAAGQVTLAQGVEISGDVTLEDGQLESEFLLASHDGLENLTLQTGVSHERRYAFRGGLVLAEHTVAPIEKVQLRQTATDLGAVYPDDPAAQNALILTGNYLFTGEDAGGLEAVARDLYGFLKDITYTPCTLQLPAGTDIRAGHILRLHTPAGVRTAYIMQKTQSGQRDTLVCTGNPRRDSSAAVNSRSYRAYMGKVLELRADVEGLKVENRRATGQLAQLRLDVEGIGTRVQRQQTAADGLQTQLTSLQQDADTLRLSVERITQNGVDKVTTATGYTFAADGLRIRKDGGEMENLLDDTGMYVGRSGQVILQANNAGVVATDVTVRNYLVVGEHARFEDYTDGTDSRRTACFWT